MRHPLAFTASCVLLAVGILAYTPFVSHVLERGDKVVNEKWGAPEARQPVQWAWAGIASFAISGVAGLAALGGNRWQPLAGMGLPMAVAALMGLLAFQAGPAVFAVAGTVLACFAAAALGTIIWGQPKGPLWRVILHTSWMAIGTLLALAGVAFGALGVLERRLPGVPWSAILAAVALATLLRAISRHLLQQAPEPLALPHRQIRQGLDTPEIRLVAERLHPYLDEGREVREYVALTQQLANHTQATPPAHPPETAPINAASPTSALAATLRAAALCLPPAFLLSGSWAATLPLLLLGAVLPWMRRGLLPRGEPLPAAWWGMGAAVLAMGSVGASLSPGGNPALAFGATLSLAYLGLGLSRRNRALPDDIAFRRTRKAHAVAQRAWTQILQGALLASAFLAAPLAVAGLPSLIGVTVPAPPLRLVLAGTVAGLCWALGARAAGLAAQHSLGALDEAHAQQQQRRRAAHRQTLEILETT